MVPRPGSPDFSKPFKHLRLGTLGVAYAQHLFEEVEALEPWVCADNWNKASALVAPYVYAHDPRALPAAKFLAQCPWGSIPAWALEIREWLWETHILDRK